jgi:outer membrane protein
MKFIPALVLSFLACLVLGGSAAAQTAAPQNSAKIAVVDTSAFNSLIVEFRQQIENLQREFGPSTEALQKMGLEIQGEEDALQRLADSLPPEIRQKRLEDLEKKKIEFKRKQEDLKDAVDKRAGIVLGPLQEKIGKALEAYAKERGITMLLDLGTAAKAGGLFYIAPGIDVTDDFAAKYNAANPGKKPAGQ